MSHLPKLCGLISACLTAALLSSLPVRADDSLGASVFFADSGASLVGSLIQLGGQLDGEIGDLAPAARDMRSDSASEGAADVDSMARARLGMARPQIRSSTTKAVGVPAAGVSNGTSRDAFKFSRAALPILIESLPGISATSLSQVRPMVGPAVGVRPSYVKAASYR